MLKLTKKADYGLMALKYLAEHPEKAALSAKDVADAYGIPAQLLAKILQLLTKHGLLRSHAGMNGGYALARDAREISAYEVIHAIDGPFFITSCTKGAKNCDLTPSCTIKEPLARVNDTICRGAEEHQHSRPGRARTTRTPAARAAGVGCTDALTNLTLQRKVFLRYRRRRRASKRMEN